MADFSSSRQSDARRAFGDPVKSAEVHGRMMESFNVEIRKNGALKNRALVLSGLLGLCGASAITAAVVGAPSLWESIRRADHAPKAVLWAVSGGLGLGMIGTSCFTFERAIYDLELRRELWEIENHLAGELQEMIAIYKTQGLTEEEALYVTRTFAKRPRLFAQLMMVEELGYSRLEPPTAKEAVLNVGLPTVLGFVVGLLSPLLPLLSRSRQCAAAAAVAQSSGSLSGGVSRSVQWVSAGLLALGTLVTSVCQVEVFYGGYTQAPLVARTIAANMVGVGAMYALSYVTARYV